MIFVLDICISACLSTQIAERQGTAMYYPHWGRWVTGEGGRLVVGLHHFAGKTQPPPSSSARLSPSSVNPPLILGGFWTCVGCIRYLDYVWSCAKSYMIWKYIGFFLLVRVYPMFGCSMIYDENKKDLCQIFVLYIAYIWCLVVWENLICAQSWDRRCSSKSK